MTKKMRVINLIIWGALTLLWTALTAAKIGAEGSEAWEIVMNALVAVLSLVNFVVHLVFLLKRK